MKFYSTNRQSSEVGLKEALFKGLPPDNGLYLPTNIPTLPQDFFESIQELTLPQIALEVSKALLKEDIEEESLKKIVDDAIDFDAPVVRINDSMYILELFHGPTLAFKDFGARFMARLISHYVKESEKDINILVATSGDTGSAVAQGFLDVKGVNVVVLYPKGKVSPMQEKQFTTLGKNIIALEINGNFDDCQRLVKTAFLDEELNNMLHLTSANSINVGRLIPQTFYYFNAYAQLKSLNKPLVFSIPSGNFGNLCGGLIAKKMGLPVEKFIAATNINDIVPIYLLSGLYEPRPSVPTISNAMDVGNPSNFARILALYDNDIEKIKEDIYGAKFTDEQTKYAVNQVSARYEYTLDPHSAVGYLGLEQYFKDTKRQEDVGVILSTAHPSKFREVVEEATGSKVIVPDRLRSRMKLKKQSIPLGSEYEGFRKFILSRVK
jgi:threonine synthase